MLAGYGRAFPLTPVGGCFIVGIGLAVTLGAVWPQQRLRLVGLGLGLGVMLIYLGLRPLSPGVPRPGPYAIWSIPVAILVEAIAFVLIMPRVRPLGERAAGLATLAIVSAHFLIMLPAFGPLFAGLSLVGLCNVWRGWKRAQVSFGQLWLIDGVLKVLFGCAMIATAPALSG